MEFEALRHAAEGPKRGGVIVSMKNDWLKVFP
jgi:hypothetical protein